MATSVGSLNVRITTDVRILLSILLHDAQRWRRHSRMDYSFVHLCVYLLAAFGADGWMPNDVDAIDDGSLVLADSWGSGGLVVWRL